MPNSCLHVGLAFLHLEYAGVVWEILQHVLGSLPAQCSCHRAGEAGSGRAYCIIPGTSEMRATQGQAPELVTCGGGGGEMRQGEKGHELSFLQNRKRPSSCPYSPGPVHAEPEKRRDRDSGAPNHSGLVSRAPPLSLECRSRPRPTPQSQPQSSQAESSLSLGWGGNRMWGGGPHPNCLGGVSSSPLPPSPPLVSWLEQA